MSELEEDYETLIRSLYDKLREDVEIGELTLSRAEDLASMLLSRTGVTDHATRHAWNNSGCSYDDDGWYDSGCSI